MFPHYITGPTTQREEVLRERKIKFLNFIVCVCVFVCVCVCVCVCVFVTCFNRFEGGVGGGGNDPWLCTDDLSLG